MTKRNHLVEVLPKLVRSKNFRDLDQLVVVLVAVIELASTLHRDELLMREHSRPSRERGGHDERSDRERREDS